MIGQRGFSIFISLKENSSWLKLAAVTSYLPVATEGQINRQWENVIHKLLESVEKETHLLIGYPETEEDPDGHLEGQALGFTVHVDGLRVGAPHPQRLLDHLLYLWQVALQSLMAEDLSKNLDRKNRLIELLHHMQSQTFRNIVHCC